MPLGLFLCFGEEESNKTGTVISLVAPKTVTEDIALRPATPCSGWEIGPGPPCKGGRFLGNVSSVAS